MENGEISGNMQEKCVEEQWVARNAIFHNAVLDADEEGRALLQGMEQREGEMKIERLVDKCRRNALQCIGKQPAAKDASSKNAAIDVQPKHFWVQL